MTEYMLETFEPEEIKAVIAHEVGHIKGKHLWINAGVAISWFAFWGGLVFLLYRLFKHPSPALVSSMFLFSYFFYTMFIQGKVSMRNEFKADEFAAKIVGKEVMIRTLEKLGRTNLAPRRMGKTWKYLFMTCHPLRRE
ncbi:M48 family metalloprotease [Thermococcus stetteri]|uniref:M48 family metalloprotease n=1 Tax=Thermococcus stetteri TaxID=49900 RepID=UPI003158F26E